MSKQTYIVSDAGKYLTCFHYIAHRFELPIPVRVNIFVNGRKCRSLPSCKNILFSIITKVLKKFKVLVCYTSCPIFYLQRAFWQLTDSKLFSSCIAQFCIINRYTFSIRQTRLIHTLLKMALFNSHTPKSRVEAHFC